MTENTICSVCGDTGEITKPIEGNGPAIATVTVGCTCAEGTKWVTRHRVGFKFPDWGDNPPPPWVKVS